MILLKIIFMHIFSENSLIKYCLLVKNVIGLTLKSVHSMIIDVEAQKFTIQNTKL